MPWFVYVARCGDGTLYTGVTTDVDRRMVEHNAGRGAAYTRSRAPVRVVHVEPAAGRGAALSREFAIKRMPRGEKMRLIGRGDEGTTGRRDGSFVGFSSRALRFMRGLKRHNDREWFEAHRAEYELYVRDPMRGLVEEIDARLGRIAPEMVGDPKRSIFRINRDVRFSSDKSPYKTHAAAQFYHRDAGRGAGVDATGAGASFYFHLDPLESFVAGGIWMPARPALEKIRTAIAAESDTFEAIVKAPAFRRRFGALETEAMLKRMPRGYGESHPAARWLRYQSFVGYRALSEAEVLGARLPAVLGRHFTALLPLVRWLNDAIGYGRAERR